MSGLTSPDLPAFICYVIVLLFGIGVANSTVNRLLADYPDRWGFVETWTLFFAHALLPVLLFWFLDYTSVIKDTSLFAALIVAFGYRQIFRGDVDGITLPGQTASVWKPFQAWVTRVSDRIATINKRYRDRFDEDVRRRLALEPNTTDRFETLVLAYAKDPAELQAKLQPLKADPPVPGAARRRLLVLWEAFRVAEPENYRYFLKREGFVSKRFYWKWNGRARAKITSILVAALLLGALAAGGVYLTQTGKDKALFIRYYCWRFTKQNASDRDRFRSSSFIGSHLTSGSTDEVRKLMLPIIKELQYKGLDSTAAANILRLSMDFHRPIVDPVVIPGLIESLRTENIDVRGRVHRALLDLQRQAYEKAPVDSLLITWTPDVNDSPGEIDSYIRAWSAWWSTQSRLLGAATP